VGKKNRSKKNRAFNRIEKGGHHQYIEEFPPPKIDQKFFDGMIKCKLSHGLGYSIIIPDLIFLNEASKWIQPLYFTACFLSKDDFEINCRISVDISFGKRIFIKFSNQGFLKQFVDGAELYKCTIQGPENLVDYGTGTYSDKESLAINLFHHTSSENYGKILKSKHLRSSPWNFQGTNDKVLSNVNYSYFTCLDSIKAPEDLNQIAMASNGIIALLRDNGSTYNPNDIVKLKVCRESTQNRTHPIQLLVDVQNLAPSHLIKHFPFNEQVYYQVMNPFIYRVGLLPGEVLPFTAGIAKPRPGSLKRFEYVVIGDGREVEGLIAPFDEENTKNILKIQKAKSYSNILEFWFEEGNQDLFSGKTVELQTFDEIMVKKANKQGPENKARAGYHIIEMARPKI